MKVLARLLFDGFSPITVYPLKCTTNYAVANDALQHVENTAQLALEYDQNIFTLLVNNESFGCEIENEEDGTRLFTGMVSVDTSWTDMGNPWPISEFSITARDSTEKLNKEAESDLILVDTTLEAVCAQLETRCGVVFGTIPQINLEEFSVRKGENYLSKFDALCFQYLHTFYFDRTDLAQFFSFSIIPESNTFSNDDIIAELQVNKTKKKYTGVKITYNALITKLNELVFIKTNGYDSENKTLPFYIGPGEYYPPEATPAIEATDGKVSQTFDSGYSEVITKYNGESDFRRSKQTTLFHTLDHVVVNDWDGSIAIDRTDFTSLGASLRLRNNGSADAELYQFAIRAKAIYRGGDSTVTAGSETGKLYKTSCEFIHAATQAETLAQILTQFFLKGSFAATLKAERDQEPGQYLSIDSGASGFTGDMLFLSQAFDAETDIYTYKMISFKSPMEVVSRTQGQSDEGKGQNERAIEQLGGQVDIIQNGTETERPDDIISVAAVAKQDYIEITWPWAGTGLKNSLKRFHVEISKDSGQTWSVNYIAANRFTYFFNRSTDGYPEKTTGNLPLNAWRVRVRAENIYGQTSIGYGPSASGQALDLTQYLTWIPPAPVVTAVAEEKGLQVSWSINRDAYYGTDKSFNVRMAGRVVKYNEQSLSFFSPFDRAVDGYPETVANGGTLNSMAVTVTAVTVENMNGAVGTALGIDVSKYLTWKPAQPLLAVSASGRNVTLAMRQGNICYGFAGFRVQIQKTADGANWYAPGASDQAYTSETAYRTGAAAGYFLTPLESFNQQVPLVGQTVDLPVDTSYYYRIYAVTNKDNGAVHLVSTVSASQLAIAKGSGVKDLVAGAVKTAQLADGAGTQAKLAQGANANIMPYDLSSFENHIPGAVIIGSNVRWTSMQVVNTVSADGSKSLYLKANAIGADAYAYIEQTVEGAIKTIPVVPGKKYIFSLYARAVTADTRVQLYIRYANGASHVSTPVTAVPADGAWHRVSLGWICPASGTTYITPRVDFDNPTAIAEGYIDALQFEEVQATATEPSAYKSPAVDTIQGQLIKAGTVEAAQIKAKTITTEEINVVARSKINSLLDESDGLDGWSGSAMANGVVIASDGARAIRSLAQSAISFSSAPITVAPDELIEFTFGMEAPNYASGSGLYIGLTYADTYTSYIWNDTLKKWIFEVTGINRYFITDFKNTALQYFKTYILGSNVDIADVPAPKYTSLAGTSGPMRCIKLPAGKTSTTIRTGNNTMTAGHYWNFVRPMCVTVGAAKVVAAQVVTPSLSAITANLGEMRGDEGTENDYRITLSSGFEGTQSGNYDYGKRGTLLLGATTDDSYFRRMFNVVTQKWEAAIKVATFIVDAVSSTVLGIFRVKTTAGTTVLEVDPTNARTVFYSDRFYGNRISRPLTAVAAQTQIYSIVAIPWNIEVEFTIRLTGDNMHDHITIRVPAGNAPNNRIEVQHSKNNLTYGAVRVVMTTVTTNYNSDKNIYLYVARKASATATLDVLSADFKYWGLLLFTGLLVTSLTGTTVSDVWLSGYDGECFDSLVIQDNLRVKDSFFAKVIGTTSWSWYATSGTHILLGLRGSDNTDQGKIDGEFFFNRGGTGQAPRGGSIRIQLDDSSAYAPTYNLLWSSGVFAGNPRLCPVLYGGKKYWSLYLPPGSNWHDNTVMFAGHLRGYSSVTWTTLQETTGVVTFDGTQKFPNIVYYDDGSIRVDGSILGKYGKILSSRDEWLRLNDGDEHTNGTYAGNKPFRVDGDLQVGPNGDGFHAFPSGSLFGQHIETEEAARLGNMTTAGYGAVSVGPGAGNQGSANGAYAVAIGFNALVTRDNEININNRFRYVEYPTNSSTLTIYSKLSPLLSPVVGYKIGINGKHGADNTHLVKAERYSADIIRIYRDDGSYQAFHSTVPGSTLYDLQIEIVQYQDI